MTASPLFNSLKTASRPPAAGDADGFGAAGGAGGGGGPGGGGGGGGAPPVGLGVFVPDFNASASGTPFGFHGTP